MLEHKFNINSQTQKKNETIFKKVKDFIFTHPILKHRKEILRIIFSALNVCFNAFLMTRIRFLQLGNLCSSSNYDNTLGCNSVFSTLVPQGELQSNSSVDDSYSAYSLLDQHTVLGFAVNQVYFDQQSILSVLRLVAPFYLLLSLCLNIAELTSKKQKVDILVFVLVVITVSDLLLFNSAYSFSNIKANRQDSQLFNQHLAQYNQNQLVLYEPEILQSASRDIFLLVNKFIIAFTVISKTLAVLITLTKFTKCIETLYAIKLISKKIQSLRRSSSRNQPIAVHGNNKQQVVVNQSKIAASSSISQKNTPSAQSTKQVSGKSAQKIQSTNNSTIKPIPEENTSSLTTPLKQNLDENNHISTSSNDATQSQSITPVISNSNKKTKNNNKKAIKNSSINNQKSSIGSCQGVESVEAAKQQIVQMKNTNDNQNVQEIENNTTFEEKLQSAETVQQIQQNTVEEPTITPTQQEQEDLTIVSSNQALEVKEHADNEDERRQVELEEEESLLQQRGVPLNDSVCNQNQKEDNQKNSGSNSITTSDTANHDSSKFQKLKSQESLDLESDTGNLQCANQNAHQQPEEFGKEEQVQPHLKNYKILGSRVKSTGLTPLEYSSNICLSPNFDFSLINHQTNSPQTITTFRQNSCETSDFSLGESSQNHIDPVTPLSVYQKSPYPILNQSAHPRIVIHNQQSEIEYNNDTFKLNNSTTTTGEQIVIEQVNEELRKKWMLKQKAMKLEKKKMNNSSANNTISLDNQNNNTNNTYCNNNNNNTSCINSSQFSSYDNNTSYNQGQNSYIGNNNYLSHDQQILQEDLDISTNDESNFTSINSNYDASSITKQNYNPMNFKNLSQHLLNQQVSSALSQQQQIQQQQQLQLQQQYELNKIGGVQADNTEASAYYQNYQNSQYQEEQCYNDDHITRTTCPRTSNQSNVQSRQNQFFEDNYQDPSQKCFEEFIRINQQNNKNYQKQQNELQNNNLICPQQQKNQAFGFDYEDEECENTQGKTPFEIFYDQQCMVDEDYDEEEELDQFQENMEEEDDEEEEDDDSEEEEDDEDEDDEDEDDESFSHNKSSYRHNATQMSFQNQQDGECHSDTSAFLQSQLQNTEIYSVDELKSHLGDYLDMINDNSLIHTNHSDLTSKKFDFNSFQQIGYDESDDAGAAGGEDGKKKKKRKKKSKEQKRKRRCKRKLKKKLEKSMIDCDLSGPLFADNAGTMQTPSTTTGTTPKKSSKNKKNNKNKNKQSSAYQNTFESLYGTSATQNNYLNQSGLCLKRMLDENLLEYFTFTVVLSQGLSVNIYITDFYQFDEQFEMQSFIYGIDSHTILDVKLNLIYEISSQNLYPNMTPYFEHLIQTYSMTKLATCITQSHLDQYASMECSETMQYTHQFEENTIQPSEVAIENSFNIDNSIYCNLPMLVS